MAVTLLARGCIDVFERVENGGRSREAGGRVGQAQVLQQAIKCELRSTLAVEDGRALDARVRAVGGGIVG